MLRDLGLLVDLAEQGLVSAALSVPTLDERAWRATEPHTPHPRARLEAVAELNRAGVPTSVLVAPLMPGINDEPEQVRRILELANEAGARSVTPIALHLRPGVREVFMDWLEAKRPDLVDRYGELYGRRSYARGESEAAFAGLVRDEQRRLAGRVRAERFLRRRSERSTPRSASPSRGPDEPAPEQPSLLRPGRQGPSTFGCDADLHRC